MDKNKEYYYSGANGYVTFWGEVKENPEYVIVLDGGEYGELLVIRKKDLIPKEESYLWKQAEKKAAQLRAITAKAEENFDKVVEKVIKKATDQLSSRMKLNVVFGKGMDNNGWAIPIANELTKLVKENAKEVVEDKKDIFS